MSTILSTPITTSVTQYDLWILQINFVAQTVTAEARLLDATGKVLDTASVTKALGDLGLSPTEVTTLQMKVTQYLKNHGVIN